MLLLGSVYSYSLYRVEIEHQFNIHTTLSGLPYMMSLFTYAVSMFITGKYLRQFGLKWFILLGGGLLVSAWFLASLSTSLWMFTLSYGVIMGISVGILYGTALQFVQRYFKSHTSFWVGLMLFAFGLSSVILSPIVSIYLTHYSMASLFQIYAVLSLILVVLLWFIYPYEPKHIEAISMEHPPFMRLLFIFMLATMIGLTMIGLTHLIGTQEYRYPPLQVALSISLFASFNAISRPLFGYGMDRYGFKKMAHLSIVLIAFASVINVLNQGQSFLLFVLAYGIYWFNLGAWLAIMPSYIKKKHGATLYAPLYGKVFLGYGISAIIGTLSASFLLETFGNSTGIYLLILITLTILTFLIRQETQA
jgi:MFS transporter, OFA family, oxalate/formate antiporter